MQERINQIRESLADAFGGYSQYNFEILGQALAGQICNNGLRENSILELCAEAARQECERWEDQEWADPASVAEAIETACRAALEHLGEWHDKMPAPTEVPRRLRGDRSERRRVSRHDSI